MSKSAFLNIFCFLIALLISLNISAQDRSADSLKTDIELVTYHNRISISPIIKNRSSILSGRTSLFGNRTRDLSINLGVQFLTYINWKKIDIGLGVNYEDEDYFNLIPAYVHFAYSPDIKKNPTKFLFQSGLAFNVPQSANYDYGKPGIMLSTGIEQHFSLFKVIPSTLQLLYRIQKTTTVSEWTGNQQQTSSMKTIHTMTRLILVFGVNF